MSYGEKQRKEIETIRERTVKLKLSDADVGRIFEKAAGAGLTVEQLLANFIGDLVGGTYSNGSDERMYADQWFERCWFSHTDQPSFLQYLVQRDEVDEVIELLENVRDGEDELAYFKENPDDGSPEAIWEWQEDLRDWRERLDGCWQRYDMPEENRSEAFAAVAAWHQARAEMTREGEA